MFPDPNDPYSAAVFLENWEMEIRAGYTSMDELELMERLNEYLDPDVPPDVEAALVQELKGATELLLQQARDQEASWQGWTPNDRLSAAFEDLNEQRLFARECAGLTIQDGWGTVGVEADPRALGAVFFHQQDVFDALRGFSLPLAFGVCSAGPATADDRARVAETVLDTLARHGVAAAWSGDPRHRIEVLPFEWSRRRWTSRPAEDAGDPAPWQHKSRQDGLFPTPTADALAPYHQPVTAYHSTAGFDAQLAFVMRGVWIGVFHQERGQVGHHGEPHIFVRAGHQTVMMPCDGLSNLDPGQAAALRQRGMAARPAPAQASGPTGEPPRPWWRFRS